MPRQARKKSESGIYHVILRGINKQIIFEDDEDNDVFLSILRDYKPVSGYKLLAFCLMENHIHLLIKVEEEPLDRIFRRIAGKYVFWYNNKYQRIGHLFQDRYKSEPVEDDTYLLTVIRYIHQNPLKAKTVKNLEDHSYSSYNDYISDEKDPLTDTEFLFGIMNREEFIRFHEEQNDDSCLEITEKSFYLTDEKAKQLIQKLAKCKATTDVQKFDVKTRNKIIHKLKEHGASIRQLSRLTGISKSIIEKL